MDNIRQYQRLSNIKPSYQKLTKPYFSVSQAKIKRNASELDLYYKGLGLWEPAKEIVNTKRKRGGVDDENKKEKVALWHMEFEDEGLLEI